MRADATRNRARLLDAATAAYTSGGGDVSLESIAREAGVGIGTLYRHFPSRERLVEAVYAAELARLCDSAPTVLRRRRADRALRRWMDAYVKFVSTKRGMADALRAIIASGAVTSAGTREQLGRAVAVFLDAGRKDGSLRTDVPAGDVVAAMAGVVLTVPASQPQQTERLLDLLVDGLRPRP